MKSLKMAGTIAIAAAALLILTPGAGRTSTCMEAPKADAARVLHRAMKLQEEKKGKEAMNLLAKTMAEGKINHYLIPYHLGNHYAERGNNEKALENYLAAEKLCPEFYGTHQNIGRAAWELERHDLAAKHLVRAFELQEKKNPDLLYNAAVISITGGRMKRALPLLQRLLAGKEFEPQFKWLKTLVGVCAETEKSSPALSTMERLKPKMKGIPEFWRLKALVHVGKGQYRKAVSALHVFNVMEPELGPSDRGLLADLCMHTGLPLAAAAHYEKLPKKDLALYRKLASAYLTGCRPDRSVDAINRALKHHRRADLYFMRGRIEFDQEKYSAAFQSFDECLALNPKNGKAHLLKGYSAFKMGRDRLAVKALKVAANYPAQKKEASRMLGWLDRKIAEEATESNSG